MLKEFKEFALRGNVLDLAIGVIIGGSFGKIVTSFVNDLIMPLLGLLTSGNTFTGMSITLRDGDPPLTLNYGAFIQNIIDFLLIAAAIFIFIKLINRFFRKQDPPVEIPEEEPELSTGELLLVEIRDLLANAAKDGGKPIE
ncbi:MAG: large-conductance mechanosensitive channel protein MscL [Clostridiales bacterium]|nr:large-conductance mechanosensitive channel protein MscL [Clostridiales bacterium]